MPTNSSIYSSLRGIFFFLGDMLASSTDDSSCKHSLVHFSVLCIAFWTTPLRSHYQWLKGSFLYMLGPPHRPQTLPVDDFLGGEATYSVHFTLWYLPLFPWAYPEYEDLSSRGGIPGGGDFITIALLEMNGLLNEA
jgi:hypothetical protein